MSDHDERWVLDHLIALCRDEEQTLRFANAAAALAVTGMFSNDFWVYPNPNFGQFQVRFFNLNPETATVNVYNSSGMRVFQKTMLTTLPYSTIDINLAPTAASGSYVVELVNGSGKRVGAKMIVVRHN